MNAIRERFAQQHGIDVDRVNVIVRMAQECKLLNEKYSNGDPHPRNPTPTDKARNAELWGNAVGVATAELQRYVDRFGLGWTVEYTGLRPCLKDKAGRYVEIPG